MQVGNQTITREDMSSFSWFKDNPDHTYQRMQDILHQAAQQNASIMAQPNISSQSNNRSNTWQ